MRRRLTTIAALALGIGATPAFAVDLCARLTLPEAFALQCAPAPGAVPDRIVVTPVEGTFKALSQLSLRQLDRAADALAWEDPALWLERQMVLDAGGLAAALRDLGSDPDSPFGSDLVTTGIELLVAGLDGLGRLPLAACGDGPTASEITCQFGTEPLSLLMHVTLVAADAERYAFNMRTFNAERLRHFTQIARSFSPK